MAVSGEPSSDREGDAARSSSVSPAEGAFSPRSSEVAVAALAFLAATWVYLGPSIGSIVGRLGPDLGDPRFNLYLTSWVARWVGGGAGSLWSPPFFHPTSGVLAYSDHMIGPGIALAALGRLGVPPVTAFNLLFLASFVLSATTAYWLARRLGVRRSIAFVAGWLVAFSHLRWTELSHFQVLRVQWIPLVLWTFDRCLTRPGWKTSGAFLIAYLLQVSGGSYLTWIVHVPMLVLLIVRVREAGLRRFVGEGRGVRLAATASGTLAILAPFVHGYLAAYASGVLSRRGEEVRSLGAVVADFARPSHDALLHSVGLMARSNGRLGLFPGVVALTGLLLAAGAWIGVAIRTGRPRDRIVRGATAAAGAGLTAIGLAYADRFTLHGASAPWPALLGSPRYDGPRWLVALGVAAIIWATRAAVPPAPRPFGSVAGFRRALWISGAVTLGLALPVGFTSFSRWVPGMDGMRAPHRFLVVTSLAVALAAALGLDRTLARIRRPTARVTLALLALAVAALEATPRRWDWVPVPETDDAFPPYAQYLAGDAAVGAYVEAPLLGDWRETERMWTQTRHWKPMVNGYSARLAGSYKRARGLFEPFPDREGLDRLRRLGVTHVVVHRLSETKGGRIPLQTAARRAVAAGWIAPRFADGPTTIYEILPDPGPDSVPAPEPDSVRR